VPKSYNGVQMSFVILNLFVIVVDSIVSLQSRFFYDKFYICSGSDNGSMKL
jgi:hypothetical protein